MYILLGGHIWLVTSTWKINRTFLFFFPLTYRTIIYINILQYRRLYIHAYFIASFFFFLSDLSRLSFACPSILGTFFLPFQYFWFLLNLSSIFGLDLRSVFFFVYFGIRVSNWSLFFFWIFDFCWVFLFDWFLSSLSVFPLLDFVVLCWFSLDPIRMFTRVKQYLEIHHADLVFASF